MMFFSPSGVRPSIKASLGVWHFEGNAALLLLYPQTGQKQIIDFFGVFFVFFSLQTSLIQAASCSILLMVLLVSGETDMKLIKIKG